MLSRLRHILRERKGSAMVLSLVTSVVLLAAGGAYYVSTTSGLSSASGYAYANAAQAAAEAGIRYATAHAKDNTPDATRVWNQATIPTTATALSNAATFKVTVQSDTLPTGLTGSYFLITSTGVSGSSTRVVRAYLNIPPPGVNTSHPATTFDLFQTAAYDGNPWTFGQNAQGTDIVKAPQADAYNKVLFGDQVDASTGFTLQYNVKMNSIVSGHPNDNGYGIYYMVQGAPGSRNPDSPSGYVVQYDPGLTPDQILVKKVRSGSEKQYGNQTIGSGRNAYSFDNESFQATNDPRLATTSWDSNKKLKSTVVDVTGNQDLMIANMTNIWAGINGGHDAMLGTNHQITIDVKTTGSLIIHSVSIDGWEILKFADRGSSVGGSAYTSGGTGFRVWEADVDFYNNTNPGSGTVGQYIPGSPIKLDSWGVKPQ